MGKLTTHVLDTALGRPGAGMTIDVFAVDGDARRLLGTAITNADGRCDAPLVEGADFVIGQYELVFYAGDYFFTAGLGLPAPNFLDRVVVRFGVSDATADYHVPLLVSPWAYTTYRGS